MRAPKLIASLRRLGLLLTAFFVSTFIVAATASAAISRLPNPAPGAGSYGIEAEKPQPPPQTTATVSTPINGANFSTSPITVTGLCTQGLLVQVYDNGVFVGAANCTTGSFSVQVTLFTGQNDIDAIQYDDLAQASPDSNHITVFFNNASISAFGTLITLTSNYGRRAANPGDTLSWPVLLSGGNGPYAFSIDWGDGQAPSLQSQALPGTVNISHVYKQSGIYRVVVKVVDKNGVTAFLQLVAVANGKPTGSGSAGGSSSGGSTQVVTKVVWLPALVTLVLLLPAFWLGRRSELVSLHRKLERDMEKYKDI